MNKQKATRPKKQLKELEEDEYFTKLEEIVKRDFYPDLVKMEKLQEYEEKLEQQLNGEVTSVDVPSALLKSTGKSFLSVVNKNKDQVDYLIAKKRTELGLSNPEPIREKKMGLNEYMRKFTSEDNASFQELHDADRDRFLAKIAWMYSESEEYAKINNLAIENGQNSQRDATRMIEDDSGKLKTVPAIGFGGHEA